jgi:hypothetical protein
MRILDDFPRFKCNSDVRYIVDWCTCIADKPPEELRPRFKGSSALSVQGGDGKLDEFDTLKVWANMLIL